MSRNDIDDVTTEVDAWLDENWDPDLTVGEWWQRPMLPENAYGRGWSRPQAQASLRAMAARKVLGPPPGLGMMLAAPTIAAHGTQEQIDRFIPRILNGQDAWCQLFSEPQAGSDLAGLQTKAEQDGDEWIVNGQKVWTSGGNIADMGMLIARTDPQVPKHQGISYFAFPMHQDGVEVRPLREMTGRAFFSEVFMTDARVDGAALLGDRGNGWRIANTTLMEERSSIGAGSSGVASAHAGSVANQFAKRVGDVASEGKSGEAGAPGVGMGFYRRYQELATKLGRNEDPHVRQQLVNLYIRLRVNRLNLLRAKSGQNRTGGEGNIAKLFDSALHHDFREVGMSIIGADGMLSADASTTDSAVAAITLFSSAPSIYGGTNEVQKNIIGERVLGLPKEPGPGKDTPFDELPRNV